MSDNDDLARSIALGTGALRVGVGLALLRWRRMFSRFAGATEGDETLPMLFAYWGARDIAVGVGALASALRSPSAVPAQLVVQGAADSTDAVLIGAVHVAGRMPRWSAAGAFAMAVGTAAAEFAAARWLRARVGA